MSEPFFEIQQVNTFVVKMDLQTLASLEKGMSFYSERSILPDGDPAKDLSRKLTSLLLKMAVTRNLEEAPETSILPPPKEEAVEVVSVEETPGATPDPAPLTEEQIQEAVAQVTTELNEAVEGSQTVSVDDPDPLEEQLDAMIDG